MKPDSVSETWLIFDLESDNLYDSVTVTHCIVLYDIGRKQTFTYGPDHIADALAHLATADVLIGHNIIFYDLPVLQKLHSFATKTRIIDTLICTRLIWPKELLYDRDTEQYTQVPKNLRGSASLKAWGWRLADHKIDFKDFSVYSEEMLKYCVQDVEVTKKLWEHICKQHYSEAALKLEHDFALAINKQIRSGVSFDLDAALDLVDVLRARQKELEDKLKQIFPPITHSDWFTPKVNNTKRGYVKGVPFEKIRIEEFNPGSRQQIADRLAQKYGWKPEKTTKKGNPILDDDVLETLPYPEAKPLAEYMLIKKRLGQIADGNNAWIKLFNNESGCIHGDLITNGCITGRCAHRNPNMGQVPAAYSPYGKECRNLFHAPYSWDLIGIDAKALELRCLAGYFALWDNGEYASLVVNPKVDIHTYNQEQFGVATRDISKRLLYACVPSDITTVLTKEGWKKYDELKVGQLVLTYNEEKEIKEWKPILEIIPEHEDGVWQMEHNHSFKVQATADHRWYVKQRKANKDSSCGWFTGNKQRRYMEPEVRTTATINTESNIVVNAPLVDLDSSGITIQWQWRKYGTNWSSIVLQMNSNQRKAWLSGFMLADGFQSCKLNQKEKWHWTQVRNEHFEAALLASYLEFPGVIHVAKPRLNSSGTVQMHVSIANKGHVTGQKLQKTFVGKKKVFCIRTENKSFVMRQGDCITITGNCLYGAGALKMGTIINPDEKNELLLRQLGSNAINSFMKGVPALKKLKQQIDETIGSRGYLRGLDRRILHCRSAFKGLNVLLQSAGAILMKQVVVFTHRNIEQNLGLVYGQDWQQLLMVHDEIQIACHPDYTDKIREQAMMAFPQAQEFFGFNCLIEGDSRVGKTWADTH
jgi:DNA polymerase I-like protein with 3'-5' exonuclease and polymerase domains